MKVKINSEIGKLQYVIIHFPGAEIENMTPMHAEKALYSDILNLSVISREYREFLDVLNKLTRTFEVSELLENVLENHEAKKYLINRICSREESECLMDYLLTLDSKELAKQMIEGVPLIRDSYTKFLSEERFALQPLHNFFFTRDASASLYDHVLVAKPANKVRERESLIMETIFEFHPEFQADILKPIDSPDPSLSIEGGDLIVIKENLLLVGNGLRTTPSGVDFIVEHFKKLKERKTIIVQELPHSPESFIHLDMVFTMLDKDACMIYEPLLMNPHNYRTFEIIVDNGKVEKISERKNLLEALRRNGTDLEPIYCGGSQDLWIQEREQWHSGANFFAVSPGVIIGYERNVHTIEELNKKGFETIRAADLIEGKATVNFDKKTVITIQGSELSRGGGGARCMTMPILRDDVDW
jgi:arginine deiminase